MEKAKEEASVNFLLQQHPADLDKFCIHYLTPDKQAAEASKDAAKPSFQLEEYIVERSESDRWTSDIHPGQTFGSLRHLVFFKNKNPEQHVQLNRCVQLNQSF